MKKIYLKVMVAVGYVQMVTVNGLANALPINGRTTGEISDSLPNLFTPQGATFSIWGLIYLLLLLFVGKLVAAPLDARSARVGRLFVLNTVLNSAWILAWHCNQLLLSLAIMLGLLTNLVLICKVLQEVSSNKERLWLQLPFTIYFGWITIATIANATAVLVGYEWNALGIGEAEWTAVMLGAGTLIALIQLFHFRQVAYGAVIVWAFYGIYAKHTSPNGFDHAHPMVVYAALAAMIIMAVASTLILFRHTRK